MEWLLVCIQTAAFVRTVVSYCLQRQCKYSSSFINMWMGSAALPLFFLLNFTDCNCFSKIRSPNS